MEENAVFNISLRFLFFLVLLCIYRCGIAYLGGVKGNYATIGLTASVPLNDCMGQNNTAHHVGSIAKWAQEFGMSTGKWNKKNRTQHFPFYLAINNKCANSFLLRLLCFPIRFFAFRSRSIATDKINTSHPPGKKVWSRPLKLRTHRQPVFTLTRPIVIGKAISNY